MVYSSQLIHAVAKPLPGQSSKGGTGTVERRVDPSTYVINLGRENLTVKVTEGALSVGQQVAVAVRNERFIITRMPAPDAEAADDADSFTRQGGSSRSRAPLESQRNVRAGIETIIENLSAQPFRQEDARKCEALFRTLSPQLSSIDKTLAGAVSTTLQSLAAAPQDAPIPVRTVRDAIDLMEQLREKIPAPPSGRSVALQSPVPEGLYRFESASEALDFLKPASASREPFARELLSRSEGGGPVVVRTVSYDNQHTVATIVTKEEVSRELASLPGRFTSRAFQSIPPAVFEQLLDNRGSINLDQLRVLDGVAAGLRLPAASTRAGSRAAQDAALLQWLTSVVDSRTPSASLSSLLPVFSAQSIIDSLEEIAQSASKLSGTPPALPVAETFSITQGAVLETTDRSRLLETIIRRLGFTLENSLATTGRPDGSSLKQRLLETAGALQAEPPLPPAEAGVGAKQALAKMTDDFISAVRTQLAPLLSAAENDSGGAGGAFRRDIEAALQKGADELSRLLTRLTGEAKELVRSIPEKLTVASRSAINAFTGAAAEQIENLAQEIARAVEDIVRKTAGAPQDPGRESRIVSAPPEKPVAAHHVAVAAFADKTGKQIEALLREFTNDSEAAIAKRAAKIARLLAPPGGEAEASKHGNAARPAIVKIPAASLAILNTFTGDAAKQIETLLLEIERAGGGDPKKDVSREIARLLDRLAGEMKKIAESAARTLPAKITGASLATTGVLTGDAGKRIDARVQKLSHETDAYLKKAVAELAGKLDRLAGEAKELAARTASARPDRTSAAVLHQAVAAFADDAAQQIETQLRQFPDDTEAAVAKRAGEPLPAHTPRELSLKISAASLAVLDDFAADTAKKIETLFLEIERATGGDPKKEVSREVATLLDKLAAELKKSAEAAVRALPAKVAAAVLAALDDLAGDAGKNIEATARGLAHASEAAVRKASVEIAGMLDKLAGDVKQIAGHATRPAATQPDSASSGAPARAEEKTAVALRQAVDAFADDAAAAIKKNAVEIARLLTPPSGKAKEAPPASPVRALPEKMTAAARAVLDDFAADTAKRIETLLGGISRASEDDPRKDPAKIAALLNKLADTVKALPAKITAAALAALDDLAGDAGKNIEAKAREISRETEVAVRKASAEIAGLLEKLAGEANALTGRTASSAQTQTDDKTAVALRQAVTGFADDAGKRIETQLKVFSDAAAAAIKKNAAEIAQLLTPPSGGAKEPLHEKISAPVLAALNNFTADSVKRIETLLNEISRTGEGDLRTGPAKINDLLNKLADEVKNTAKSLPAKITAAVLAEINDRAGDAGKRIEAQAREVARETEAAVRKASAEIAGMLDKLAGEAKELAGRAANSARPQTDDKTAAALRQAVTGFADDAGKRIEAQLKVFSDDTAAAIKKNAAEIAQLLTPPSGETEEPRPESTVRALPDKMAAAARAVLDTFTADMSRASRNDLRTDPAKISALLNKLADSAKALPAEITAAALTALDDDLAGDVEKNIEAKVRGLARESEAAVRKASVEIAGMLDKLAGDVKNLAERTTPPDSASSDAPARADEKAAAALRQAVAAFADDAGKRIEAQLKVFSDAAAAAIKKNAAELAQLLPPPSGRAVPDTFMADTVKRIETLVGEISRASEDDLRTDPARITVLLNKLADEARVAAKQAVAEMAGTFEKLAGTAKALAERTAGPAPVQPDGSSEEDLPRTAAALRQTVSAFAGDAGKRIEAQIREFSNDSESVISRNAAEIAKLLTPPRGESEEPLPAGAVRAIPDKISAPALAVLKNFSAEMVKRIETLLAEISRASEDSVRMDPARIAALLNKLADEAKNAAENAAPALPGKISAASRQVISEFSDEAGKRITALMQELSRDAEAELRKNAARLTVFLHQLAGEADELSKTTVTGPSPGPSSAKLPDAALAQTQARALPEKLAALLQSSIDSITNNMENSVDRLRRGIPSSLWNDAAEITGSLTHLADRLNKPSQAASEKPVLTSRPAIDAFIKDAGKRIDLLLTRVINNNEAVLQKGAGELDRLLDTLTAEAKLFVQTLSARLAAAAGTAASPFLDDAGSVKNATPFLQKSAGETALPRIGLEPAQTQSAVNSFAGEAERRTGVLVREFIQGNEATLQKGASELSTLLKQLTDEVKELVRTPASGNAGAPASLRPASSPLAADGGAAAQEGGNGGAKSLTQLTDDINLLARTARDLPEKISAALRSALDAFAGDAAKHGETRLREFRHDIEQFLKQESAQRSGIADAAAGRNISEAREARVSATLLSTLHSALEKELPALFAKVDDLKSTLSRTTETLFRELLHERSGPAADHARTQEPSPAKDDQALIRQSVRQNIETIINRFESLQILARQVTTPSGEQQQIIAVPIKVGTEWTEMHVRFVNKKKGKSGGAAGHYTVFLNVAPSLLGAIGATLEYTRNKNLSISMHFEHHATRQWFSANKNELTATLGDLGLPSPQISLFMERKQASAPAPAARTPSAGSSNALLDVKA